MENIEQILINNIFIELYNELEYKTFGNSVDLKDLDIIYDVFYDLNRAL